MLTGRCHCGQVKYQMPEEAIHQAICHCEDCRRHSGAPFVGWALVQSSDLLIEGELKTYESSADGRRQFCPNCGTGLFYLNPVIFPNQTDVQIATLDNPDAIVPTAQIQTAERIDWVKQLNEMVAFERYSA
ncbi:GFA family protein [Sphingomonas piscis]|uniref:GFA family protein n=1 Tax=Sphingomonas piscis TaxID=2714943 RepID=A0A6G7YRL0_9SPHN|nr:GFA family protein [Sphingomonas piscis]QIK79372.1 GFA family protein [Sphingomonas piscis]